MIKLIKSTFYKEEDTKERLLEFLKDAKILSMHDYCRKTEEKFAKKQERKYAVFVSSGSTANLALIQALLNIGKLKVGDKVAFSAVTWSTNVMPLIQLGLKPILVDCEISDLSVSVKTLKEAVAKEKGIKALFLTHALGFSTKMDELCGFCDENNILLLEDTCESLGSKYNHRRLGNFGLASTFSTYVGHHLSTIEGGFICTDSDELHRMLMMVRAHGWDRNLTFDQKMGLMREHDIDAFISKYTFYDLGFNVRPMEIQGFIGNIQIDYWDEIVRIRRENFEFFFDAMKENPDIISPDVSHMSLVSNFTVPLIFKSHELYLKYRDRYMVNNVEIRPIIAGNMAKQPFYKKYVTGASGISHKNSDYIHDNGFYFANNPELTDEERHILRTLLER